MSELKGECISSLEGHKGSVYSISWTPGKPDSSRMEEDGNEPLGYLASAGGDGNVIVWQITVGPLTHKVTSESKVDSSSP